MTGNVGHVDRLFRAAVAAALILISAVSNEWPLPVLGVLLGLTAALGRQR